MNIEESKIGIRVYSRYRDLFGTITSFPGGNDAMVKYEWPMDAKAEPQRDSLDKLDFAYKYVNLDFNSR